MAIAVGRDFESCERSLRARVNDACSVAHRLCAVSDGLVRESAGLKARQRRLRLLRCGPDFGVLGMFRPAEDQGRIAVRNANGVLCLALIGEFDFANAEELRRVFEVVAERYDRVVVDVTETTFLDSSGVYALVHATRSGMEITVRGYGPARRTLELMALNSVLDLED